MMALVLALGACSQDLSKAPEVRYDHEKCDDCGMLVSDPHFAAQLVTKAGDVFVFDDPACLFKYMASHSPSVAHTWFRDSTSTQEVWLDESRVGFLTSTGAPMNGGFAAVPAGTPGALGFGEASSAVLNARSAP